MGAGRRSWVSIVFMKTKVLLLIAGFSIGITGLLLPKVALANHCLGSFYACTNLACQPGSPGWPSCNRCSPCTGVVGPQSCVHLANGNCGALSVCNTFSQTCSAAPTPTPTPTPTSSSSSSSSSSSGGGGCIPGRCDCSPPDISSSCVPNGGCLSGRACCIADNPPGCSGSSSSSSGGPPVWCNIQPGNCKPQGGRCGYDPVSNKTCGCCAGLTCYKDPGATNTTCHSCAAAKGDKKLCSQLTPSSCASYVGWVLGGCSSISTNTWQVAADCSTITGIAEVPGPDQCTNCGPSDPSCTGGLGGYATDIHFWDLAATGATEITNGGALSKSVGVLNPNCHHTRRQGGVTQWDWTRNINYNCAGTFPGKPISNACKHKYTWQIPSSYRDGTQHFLGVITTDQAGTAGSAPVHYQYNGAGGRSDYYLPPQGSTIQVLPLTCPAPPVPSAWWQSQGGNVGAQSSLGSLIPGGKKFIKDTPGVAMYGGSVGGITPGTSGNVSSAGWLANSAVSYRLLTNSSYATLKARLLNAVTPTTVNSPTIAHSDLTSAPNAPDGVAYLYYSGTDLTINNPTGPINLGNQKVVVLADGNVALSTTINFGAGGLFVLLAGGNITVDPSVGVAGDPSNRAADFQGVYLAQGTIRTGADPGGKTLGWEGSVIGLSGINLQRGTNPPTTWPAEYFVSRPDILLNLPISLLRQYLLWSETNP